MSTSENGVRTPREGLAGPHRGVQTEGKPQAHVGAAEDRAAAPECWWGPFSAASPVRTVSRLARRQGIAQPLEGARAHIRPAPGEGDSRGLQYLDSGVNQLRAGAVARDKSYGVPIAHRASIPRSRYAVPHTYGMMPFVASNIFSRSNLPLFSTFFLWSVGTGGMLLVRPLFAASLGASVFWVSVLIASNGLARMVAAPVTGFLSDRLGRKPVVIMGVSLRAASSILAFFATSYEQFLILEFFGGMGVSVWGTASAIIMADMSGEHQRGRAVAVRTMSIRLGTVAGPFIGGVLAMAFGLPAILLFNGVTKLAVLAVIISRFTRDPYRGAAATPGGGSHGAGELPHLPLARVPLGSLCHYLGGHDGPSWGLRGAISAAGGERAGLHCRRSG